MARLDGHPTVTLVIIEQTATGPRETRYERMDPALARAIINDLRTRPDVGGRIEGVRD